VSVRRALVACTIVLPVLAFRAPASAWGAKKELAFVTPPALPTLAAVTLNAKSQTVNTTMTNFSVKDTRGTASGWNVTVSGQPGEKMSAVFAQYCPKAKCGSDAEGYVAGGHKLAANSLTLNSSGANFGGGSGSSPTLQCSSACNVDSASAVKVASATNGEETWTTSGFSATSLALAVPTTLFALANEEVYHVSILWTLSTGP
jgi:hypothetical protein